jgi:hypothetical protein
MITLPGFSSATSLLCLYYLFKYWKANASHYIITGFTITLSLYNFVTALLRAQAGYWDDCSTFSALSVQLTRPDISEPIAPRTDIAIPVGLVPLFLWLSDAFLVGCTSILWHKWLFTKTHIVVPGLGCLDSPPSLHSAACCCVRDLRR